MRQHHRRTLPCCLLAVGCVLPLSTPPATGAQGLDVLPGVKLDVEWRHRGEARGNADFDAGQADAQSGYLSRFRLGLGARLAPGLRTYVQVQDSRRVGDLKQRITNVTTLHQAFLELPAPEEGGTSLRVGRQYLSFGEKRLVSDSQWNNSARVFDGLRLTHRTDTYTLDYFSANVVTHRYQPAPAAPQGSFHGLYLSSGGGQRTVKELYTLARYRGGGLWTFGGRLRTPEAPKRVDLMCEFAWQSGRQAHHRHSAHAGIVSLGYTAPVAWTPRIGFEYAYSPGDRTPDDSVVETFDPLYPTTHPYYGIMDYFSWRNLRNARVSLSARPTTKLRLQLDYHDFRLAAAEDGWYSSSAKLLQDKTGGSGTHVGHELDFQVDYKLSARTAISAGYGHFFPGSYVARQKAQVADSDWGYLQVSTAY